MRYILIMAILFMELLVLSGCEDEVEFEVEEGPERLVVNAFMKRISRPESGTISNIRLTKSVGPMADESNISGVKGALVILKDTDNVADTLYHTEGGRYESDDIQLEYGVTYTLTIITKEGEEYQSMPQKMPDPSYVDSIYVLDKSEIPEAALSPDGQYVVVDHEVQEGRNFYRWTIKRTRKDKVLTRTLLEDDKMFVGDYVEKRFLASTLDEVYGVSVEPGDHVRVSREAITEEAYKYLNMRVNQQKYMGQPFQTPPAPLESNIYNVNDPDEVVLGFFSLSTTSNYIYVE